jgi:hypothetical protein
MEGALRRLGAPPVSDDVAFTAYQKAQVERLVALEAEFRDTLVQGVPMRGGRRRAPEGPRIYEAFLGRVREIGSVLNARPYFRERQEVFTETIGPAIQARDLGGMMRARINSMFVEWAIKQDLPPVFTKLAAQIRKLRSEIALLLMPLALSYVRVFWTRTPRSHLSFFDLFNGAIKGMMTACDKYVPPFSKVFRSVVLGRMTGELIEAYSETMVHFYPLDRRILYRANKLVGRSRAGLEGTDYVDLAARVNIAAEGAYATTPEDLAGLMSAASCVSADAPLSSRRSEAGSAPISRAARMAAPEEGNPDRLVEHGEALAVMRRAYDTLSLVERKFLMLRGVVEARPVL